MSFIAGAKFAPFKTFINIQVPLPIYRYTGLSDGAKLTLARLFLYAGREDHCYPKNETLATERGASVASVKRWLQELEDQKFIFRKQKGPGRAAEISFLWHPAYEGKQQPASSKVSEEGNSKLAQTCTAPSPKVSELASSNLNAPYKEEKIQNQKIHEGDSSSSGLNGQEVAIEASREAADDDDLPLSLKAENLKPNPTGQWWNPQDVGLYQQEIRKVRYQARDIPEGKETDLAVPDERQVADILVAFNSLEHFRVWEWYVTSKSRVDKCHQPNIGSVVYKFLSVDARNNARELEPKIADSVDKGFLGCSNGWKDTPAYGTRAFLYALHKAETKYRCSECRDIGYRLNTEQVDHDTILVSGEPCRCENMSVPSKYEMPSIIEDYCHRKNSESRTGSNLTIPRKLSVWTAGTREPSLNRMATPSPTSCGVPTPAAHMQKSCGMRKATTTPNARTNGT